MVPAKTKKLSKKELKMLEKSDSQALQQYKIKQEKQKIIMQSKKEEKNYMEATRERIYIISQQNVVKFYWDILIICLSIYNAVSLPLRIAFYQVEYEYTQRASLEAIETTVDIFFLFDVIILFLTSYIDTANGETIRQPKIIAKHYLKNGFILDFVSTLPLVLTPLVESITKVGSSERETAKNFVLVCRLMKLLRIRKLNTLI